MISKSDYLKSQAEKINKLFLSGKFYLVIDSNMELYEIYDTIQKINKSLS